MDSDARWDGTWDFADRENRRCTHSIHPYPATMIPDVAKKILETFCPESEILYDPFCGSGTSLLEANLAGMDSYGCDLNPLARLISQVKTTPVPVKLLESETARFEKDVHSMLDGDGEEYAHVTNAEYWFKPETLRQISAAVRFAETIDDENARNFFKVCTSSAIRKTSLLRNSEFKLYRIPESRIADLDGDMFAAMKEALEANIEKMRHLSRRAADLGETFVYDMDSSREIPDMPAADAVVTSPPYGDSKTTVAYGQFSRMANQWLQLEGIAASKVDSALMGGTDSPDSEIADSESAKLCVEQIADIDPARAKQVESFLCDYSRSVKLTADSLAEGGIAAYVVGNRTVKGVTIPLDRITWQCMETAGLAHIDTFVRKFPYKRMPYKTSPSNIKGDTETTMRYEYIVIAQKQ